MESIEIVSEILATPQWILTCSLDSNYRTNTKAILGNVHKASKSPKFCLFLLYPRTAPSMKCLHGLSHTVLWITPQATSVRPALSLREKYGIWPSSGCSVVCANWLGGVLPNSTDFIWAGKDAFWPLFLFLSGKSRKIAHLTPVPTESTEGSNESKSPLTNKASCSKTVRPPGFA